MKKVTFIIIIHSKSFELKFYFFKKTIIQKIIFVFILSEKNVFVDFFYTGKILKIELELREINVKITKLQKRKTELLEQKENLKLLSFQKQTNLISDQDKWTRTGLKLYWFSLSIYTYLFFLICFGEYFIDFPWYQNVQKILKTVFKLDTFRSQQLAAINITLSKHDAILIMPTGGGKSLCYQLPALIDHGLFILIFT